MVSKFFQLVSSQNFYSMVTSIARIQIIKDLLHVFLWCLYSLDTILQTLSSCSTLAYLAQTWEWDIKTSATMVSVTTTMRHVVIFEPISHNTYVPQTLLWVAFFSQFDFSRETRKSEKKINFSYLVPHFSPINEKLKETEKSEILVFVQPIIAMHCVEKLTFRLLAEDNNCKNVLSTFWAMGKHRNFPLRCKHKFMNKAVEYSKP